MDRYLIGKKIRSARENLGISQTEMGDLVGDTAQKTISAWETGRNLPETATLIKICELLDISADYLFDIRQEVENELSYEERKIIFEFRQLDNIGKNVVLGNLEMQHERCKVSIQSSNEEENSQITRKELFIRSTHPDYEKNKLEISALTFNIGMLNIDSEQLYRVLKEIYGNIITRADILLMLSIKRIPCTRILESIRIFLTVQQEKLNSSTGVRISNYIADDGAEYNSNQNNSGAN